MDPRMESIEYNGTVYDSWDDLPQEAQNLIRSKMPDTNGDGVPDVFQGGPVPDPVVSTTYSVNGKDYASLDELPPDMRAHMERAMAAGLAPGESFTERVEGEATPLPAAHRPAAQQQTLLNGQPIDQPRKPWWRRLFG